MPAFSRFRCRRASASLDVLPQYPISTKARRLPGEIMLCSLGFLILVIRLFLKGHVVAAGLMIVGMVCTVSVWMAAAVLAMGPIMNLDLAHPPSRATVPAWLISDQTKSTHHVQMHLGDRELDLFTDEHAATFDSAGHLSRLEVTDMRSDRAEGMQAIDELSSFFGVKTSLRNTKLDRIEGTSFTAGGWNVQVQLWNVMNTTSHAAQPGAGYRVIMTR